jgi:hypothetical protein
VQLQAELLKPGQHKKKHTIAAAAAAEPGVSPDAPPSLRPLHQQHSSLSGGSVLAPPS